jgi:hypothetical protein
MSKPIETWNDTYDPQVLADKYGLTVNQAKVIISSNGPSRHGCDMGALAFQQALRMRTAAKPTRGRERIPTQTPR